MDSAPPASSFPPKRIGPFVSEVLVLGAYNDDGEVILLRVPVSQGTKVIEVDPRGPAAEVRGIGERPRRIAEGVLQAVAGWAG